MPKRIDRTGHRFGMLEVARVDQKRTDNSKYLYWECVCDCGRTTSVMSGNLKKAKSCGCVKENDLTGNRVGKLTVLGRADANKYGAYRWNCICDCGNYRKLWMNSLTEGWAKSCGCINSASVDDDYWNSPNIENSYYAGLMAADGNIDKHGTYWQICLHNKDLRLIESLKSATQYHGNIHRAGVKKNMWYIRVTSKKMVDDLKANFGIIPKKSLILKPPRLNNNDHIMAFISGYIDGDGSISLNKKGLCLSILGTKGVVTWIRDSFLHIMGTDYKYIYKNGNIYTFSAWNEKAFRITEELSSVEVPRLNRKWKNSKEWYRLTQLRGTKKKDE